MPGNCHLPLISESAMVVYDDPGCRIGRMRLDRRPKNCTDPNTRNRVYTCHLRISRSLNFFHPVFEVQILPFPIDPVPLTVHFHVALPLPPLENITSRT